MAKKRRPEPQVTRTRRPRLSQVAEDNRQLLAALEDADALGGHPKPASDGHLKTGQS